MQMQLSIEQTFRHVSVVFVDICAIMAEIFQQMIILKHQENMPVNRTPPHTSRYIVKLGYAGIYLFFLFLLQNIDCGYTLELSR